LRSAKPFELPVEQANRFEFIVNLKADKQIGLTIPPNVLARSDRVIRYREQRPKSRELENTQENE
jgi:putative ABC transport system substrate-binding protein